MPTALSCLQYIYGTFVKSLNIHKECQNIKLNKNVKRLNLLKRRLEKTLILMPSKYDPNYEGKVELQFNFDKEIDYSVKYMDRRGIFQEGVDDENGTKGFIQAVHDCCDEYLKIIDTLELELSESTSLKEFPDFGSWDSVDNRSHFLLKSNVLGCVALAFDKVKDLQALQLENIYVRLSMILYQYNGKPYSHISFRNAKQKSKKTPEQCRKEVSFSVSESVEFITYLLKMEEKLNSVKKNRHQS